MKTRLTQKRPFEQKSFEIMERGLQISKSSFNNTTQTFVKYEDTGYRTAAIKKAENVALALALGALLLAPGIYYVTRLPNADGSVSPVSFMASATISGIVFLGCIVFYILSLKRITYHIDHGNINRIEFFGDPATDPELSEFLKTLKERRNAYLLDYYGDINKNLPYDGQYGKFVWLYNEEIIDHSALQAKLKELDQIYGRFAPVKGFGASE